MHVVADDNEWLWGMVYLDRFAEVNGDEQEEKLQYVRTNMAYMLR